MRICNTLCRLCDAQIRLKLQPIGYGPALVGVTRPSGTNLVCCQPLPAEPLSESLRVFGSAKQNITTSLMSRRVEYVNGVADRTQTVSHPSISPQWNQ